MLAVALISDSMGEFSKPYSAFSTKSNLIALNNMV